MRINLQRHKEIRFIFVVFLLIAALVIASKVYSLYQIHEMKKIANYLFESALKVSSASLLVQSDVYRIHRDMKDIVLSQSEEELNKGIDEVNKHEQHVFHYLKTIRQSVKDDEGKKLQAAAVKLFREWKPIRDEVIELVKSDQRDKAIAITKGKGADQVKQLENLTLKLHQYAQKNADYFKNYSDTVHDQYHNSSIAIGIGVLALLLLISYYSLQKISRHILKNAHLTDVLSIIRDINQLIVKEKNKEHLVRQICTIMVSNRVYNDAWVCLYNEMNEVECVVGADQHTNQEGAYNLQLTYADKVYGNLTVSIDPAYLNNEEEISLLNELAGDISYALYNIEREKQLREHEHTLAHMKKLYENIIDSIDNILFVKDTNFVYIVCNQAFERFVGKSNEEIIGKSDYEIFDKEVADFFRKHDIKMFEEKTTKSNFEWVTYPDGKEVYLLTVKSPLHDGGGNLIGLVGNSVDVTETKKVQDALLESEERFKMTMQQSPAVIELYDHEGTQIEVNRAYEELWGFPAEHSLHTFNLYKSDEVKKTGLLDFINRAYAGESVQTPPYEFDSTGQTEAAGKGRKRWLNTRIYPLKDTEGNVKNIVITHEDITEKREHYEQLEQKKKELETILQEAPNPIMLHNESGKIVMLNRVWQSLSGYTLEEIDTIEKWAEVACSKNKPLMEKYRDTIYSLEHKIDMGETTVTTKEGNTLIWQFSSAPLGMIDGKRTIVTSAMDITELKKKDEMMIAQSRHAAMGEMIGMIAHQWRQPIAGIAMDANNMLLDIAFETFDIAAAEGYAQDILDQTQHLSKTIDDFRNFFKPDKSVIAVSLEEIMNETLGIVKESLTNNGIAVQTHYTSETLVDAYPRELMQVFINIINNAKDSLLSSHTQEGMIEISVYDEEEYVCTQICDNGGGIPESILPKIFDPYFSTKDEKTGTGLGLYMSKMIIEEHLHGLIEASNNEDGGACFRVRLVKKGEISQ